MDREIAADGRPAAGHLPLLAFLIAFTLLALAGYLAYPSPAPALPQYIHGAAQSCDSCHHADSFQPCSECHETFEVPNTKCTQCHTGKTTTGLSCWACHAPGAPQLAPVDANCQACHTTNPHLGSSLACTSCHSISPTPHHDAVDQVAPTTCTDCHQHEEKQSHNGFSCEVCHATDVHPSFPEVPAACNVCHAADRFNGRGDCTACHAGTSAFNGKTDNDIHDATLPDATISARSCTSCHTDKQKHAAKIACLDCHADATPFHHGTAASPGFKDCVECHGDKPQHGTGLACTACHAGAQHQASPPRPAPSVCNQCHLPDTFGQKNCFNCHRTPIYHVTPSVGPCSSCHGGGRSFHAGQVACTQCHTNIFRGHHITSVRIPACNTKGCHAQQKHMDSVACTSCHGSRAQHDRTPRNLPADTWSVCGACHTFVPQALAAGVPGCPECHDAAQHRADYSVEDCVTCHTDKVRHANRVDCRLCHLNLDGGHHRVGAITARDCSQCHVGAQIHAVGTPAGAAFNCGTCHTGSVHGSPGRPTPDFCLTCHPEGEKHAAENVCIRCHWPAAHAAKPIAGEFGSFTPLAVNLPSIEEPAEPEKPSRGTFTGTGSNLLAVGVVGVLLVGLGLGLRRRRARRS